MPISDIYTARSGSVAVAATTATAICSLTGVATKRSWIVGIRMEVGVTLAAAGNDITFTLARPGNTPNVTAGAAQNAHDFSAPVSFSLFGTAWGTAPTVGTILGEWTLPQTTGSMWEEFPPSGYEWQVPAIATAAANSGLHVFATPSVVTSTPVFIDLIFSE